MDALTTLFLGVLVSGATQLMKRVFPEINPLLWVGMLATIGGVGYGIFYSVLPPEILEKIGFSFVTAVGFYEVLSAFVKKTK